MSYRTNRETGGVFRVPNSPYVEPVHPMCASCGSDTVIGFGACPSCGSFEKVTVGMRGNLSDSEVRAVVRKRKMRNPDRKPLFKCQECGRKFYSVKAAENASYGDRGCPGCGGSDIDVYTE
jgi:hypothetical protein